MHRDTILKSARAFGRALLALSAFAGASASATPSRAQTAPPGQSRPPNPGPSQAQQPQQAQPQEVPPQPQPAPPAAQVHGPGPRPPAAAPTGARGGAQAGRYRRPTFAACNRISHARGLRGGARRRFLVRCKLGYDRPRTGPSQPAPARQP